MRGYDRDEYEDYGEYEEEGEEQEEEFEDGEEEGEEYEEEEERKPTQEELEYLELRQKLKDSIRKKLKKESGSAHSNSQDKKKKLPYDNYGSFFGPSQPVIAQRVIQESKSFLETQHLESRISNSLSLNKKSSASTTTGSKPGVRNQPPKVNEIQKQLQKRRETRDYSFLLSDDVEIPAPPKDHPPRNVSTPNSEARSVQVPLKSKQPLGNGGRNGHGGFEERKSVSLNDHLHSKAGFHKLTSASKPNSTSMDSRKQLGGNNGVGPGRPSGPKALPSRTPVAPMERRAPVPVEKKAHATVEKKASAPVAKNLLPGSYKQPSSKMHSSLPKQHLEQRKGLPEPNRGKVIAKQPVALSKPQINKPLKPISSHSALQDHRPKKKPVRPFPDDEDEDLKALSLVRRMFNTQRFAHRDDDDSDMEANFDEIMKEERRSAKIARKEDEEQLRLIEEEERRERMRKSAKKRKLS